MKQKGFTLLEILLVIAAIGILASIVIVAINPGRQLAQARNAERQQEVQSIYDAVIQFAIETGGNPPSDIPVGDTQDDYQEICRQDVLEADCTTDGLLYLQDDLVPTYLAAIPEDPTRAEASTANGTGYEIKLSTGDVISLGVRSSENDEIIAVNDSSYTPPSGGGGSPSLPTEGGLYGWGQNSNGKTGQGAISGTTETPTVIGGDVTWVDVEATRTESAAINSNGDLFTWGDGDYYSIGDGNTNDEPTPVQITSAVPWEDIVVAGAAKIALKTDGTMWSWGINSSGRTGQGTTTGNTTTPTQIGSATNWASVSNSTYSSTLGAINDNGELYMWGEGSDYELGTGSQNDITNPAPIGSDTDWDQVASGLDFSIFRKTDGTIYSVGENDFGATGQGVTSGYTTSISQIGSDTDWETISSGQYHTVSLKSDGSVWGWGGNAFCQITGTDCSTGTDQSSPVLIDDSRVYTKVIAGRFSTFAIDQDGNLYGRGLNTGFELGLGNSDSQGTLVQIGSGNTWIDVAGGNSFGIGISVAP